MTETSLLRIDLRGRRVDSVSVSKDPDFFLYAWNGSEFAMASNRRGPDGEAYLFKSSGPGVSIPAGFSLEKDVLKNSERREALDPRTMKPVPYSTAILQADDPIPGARVSVVPAMSGPEKEPIKRQELWLASVKAEFPNRALIAFDATSYAVSRAGIAYTDRGQLYVRPLVRMPREDFLSAAAEVEARQLESIAKQVGTAIAIYMSDHGDKLPPAGNFNALMEKYLPFDPFLKSFTYLGNDGIQVTASTDPSKIAVGKVLGRFGTMHLNLDGSMRWSRDR